jgi:hypothetical protein
MRFEVPAAVNIKITDLIYSLIDGNERFQGTYCLCLLGRDEDSKFL